MLGHVDDLRIGHSAQQVADEAVELGIGDEMSRLHVAQRAAQHAGKAQQRCVSAGETIRAAIGADQFALDAERRGLQRNEMNVFESGAINRLTKHDCESSQLLTSRLR